MNRRLLWRLYPLYGLGFLLGLSAIGWFTVAALESQQIDAWQRDLEAQAVVFRNETAPRIGAGAQAELQRECQRLGRLASARLQIILPGGKVLCDSDQAPDDETNQAERPEVKAALAGRSLAPAEARAAWENSSLSVAVPVVREGQVVAAVRASLPASRLTEFRGAIGRQIMIAGGLIGLLTAAAGIAVARSVSRPLEQVRKGAQRLARGELGFKLEMPATGEIAGISDALNQMAQQLEERSGALTRQGYEQEAVLASMVEGVLAVDTDERIISVNAAAAALLGAAQEAARGRGLQEVIRNADLRRFVSRTLANSAPMEDDVTLRGDSERILQARGTSLRGAGGQAIGAVIVLNDVTHLRRLENIRRDFVANVSHELKTPITSIKGFVETLLDGALHNPEDAERFLKIVAKQADRLNAIIEDLLCLAKIEQSVNAADVELVDSCLVDVLRSAIDECGPKAAEKRIRMTLCCDGDLRAKINVPLLEQALMNLLDNAVKYSEAGSEIRVAGERTPGEIALHVRDQGCGISEEHLDRLFERFYRVDKARSRKAGGTGLGLSIVKHIVYVHGGKVTVESSPGKGSTFTIRLPAP